MGEEEPRTVQLRFEGGSLVEGEDGRAPPADPVEPGEEEGFVLEVRDDALDVNGALPAVVERHGRSLVFGSRTRAEEYARQLSTDGGPLRVQAAPANDARDVDAYLLAAHEPSIAEPADTEGDVWTFDVGANLYGAIGEAILTAAPKPHAVEHFVRKDLDLESADIERRLAVEVEEGYPVAVERPEGKRRWIPDCVVTARDGWRGRVLERYYCEVKTGDASFQRAQADAMAALAERERVLKVRVRIDDLPSQYGVRVEEVAPD